MAPTSTLEGNGVEFRSGKLFSNSAVVCVCKGTGAYVCSSELKLGCSFERSFTEIPSAGGSASDVSAFCVSNDSYGSDSNGDDHPLHVSSLSDNLLPTVCTKPLGGSHDDEDSVLTPVFLSSEVAEVSESAVTIESDVSYEGDMYFLCSSSHDWRVQLSLLSSLDRKITRLTTNKADTNAE